MNSYYFGTWQGLDLNQRFHQLNHLLAVILFDRNYLNFVARMRKPCPGCRVILPEICDISNTIQIFDRTVKILPDAEYKFVKSILYFLILNFICCKMIQSSN